MSGAQERSITYDDAVSALIIGWIVRRHTTGSGVEYWIGPEPAPSFPFHPRSLVHGGSIGKLMRCGELVPFMTDGEHDAHYYRAGGRLLEMMTETPAPDGHTTGEQV